MNLDRLKHTVQLTCSFFLLTLMSACALPGSSATHVSIAGELLGPQGEPIPGQQIEIILPAEYGLSDIDLSHGTPEEYHHHAQRALVTTDALGSFAHSFAPVTYSTRFWLLPPAGSFFKEPPEPGFFVRLLPNADEFYSVVVKKNNETIFAIHRAPETPRLSPVTPKTIAIDGKLLPDQRGKSHGWIATLQLKRLTDFSRSALSSPQTAVPAK